MIDLPPPDYQQVIQAISECGVARSNITVRYEDYLQSDEITISDLGSLSDEKFRCLRSAVDSAFILTIEDDAQRLAFDKFCAREDRPKQLADARAWLSTKGLLKRVPRFEPDSGIEVFAQSLELACGLQAGSALMVLGSESSTIAVRPNFVLSHTFETLTEPLACLTRMFAASDVTEHDVRFVFIGNEAVSESNED